MMRWHEVTWYSRLGAAVLFIVVVPTIFFYLGSQYGTLGSSTPNVSTQQAVLISHYRSKPTDALGADTAGVLETEALAWATAHIRKEHPEFSVSGTSCIDTPDVQESNMCWEYVGSYYNNLLTKTYAKLATAINAKQLSTIKDAWNNIRSVLCDDVVANQFVGSDGWVGTGQSSAMSACGFSLEKIEIKAVDPDTWGWAH